LAITDDQVERMASINEAYHENVGPKMLALHAAMHHMMNHLGASSIDTAKVKDLQAQIVSLKGDIAKLQTDKLLAMANVFTPEQRHALHIAMLRHHVGMMMGGGGHHGHGHMMHHGGPGGHEHGGPGGHEHGGPGGPGGE
jgi:Spy/CpxP family protein refolding chaperone